MSQDAIDSTDVSQHTQPALRPFRFSLRQMLLAVAIIAWFMAYLPGFIEYFAGVVGLLCILIALQWPIAYVLTRHTYFNKPS
jgi:hypothetical protein